MNVASKEDNYVNFNSGSICNTLRLNAGSGRGSRYNPVLGIIVGGGSLLAAITILTGSEAGAPASALAGLFIIGFESVDVAVIDRKGTRRKLRA